MLFFQPLLNGYVCFFITFAERKKGSIMDSLHFQCFGTGSSGNSYYVGHAGGGILVDAGLSMRHIRRSLKAIGVSMASIQAVFVTHDHTDHIKSVGALSTSFGIPVYATPKVHAGIESNYRVTQKIGAGKRFIQAGDSLELGGLHITAFPVSHDASECVGYSIAYAGKRLTIATDLGYVNHEAAQLLGQADYIVIEANYDEEMLRRGPYPLRLQERIRSNSGHLSNRQAACFLAENYNKRLKSIFLCHLSRENNTPAQAYSTVKEELEARQIIVGRDVEVIPLERLSPSKFYIFAS